MGTCVFARFVSPAGDAVYQGMLEVQVLEQEGGVCGDGHEDEGHEASSIASTSNTSMRSSKQDKQLKPVDEGHEASNTSRSTTSTNRNTSNTPRGRGRPRKSGGGAGGGGSLYSPLRSFSRGDEEGRGEHKEEEEDADASPASAASHPATAATDEAADLLTKKRKREDFNAAQLQRLVEVYETEEARRPDRDELAKELDQMEGGRQVDAAAIKVWMKSWHHK